VCQNVHEYGNGPCEHVNGKAFQDDPYDGNDGRGDEDTVADIVEGKDPRGDGVQMGPAEPKSRKEAIEEIYAP